jgi:hypothetical protein
MKFWTRLRWISSAAFAALLLWSWWAGDATPSGGNPAATSRTFTF